MKAIDIEVLILLIAMATSYIFALSLALMAMRSFLKRRFVNLFTLSILALAFLLAGYGLSVFANHKSEVNPVLGENRVPTTDNKDQ